jgi:ATP-dependent Lon protease
MPISDEDLEWIVRVGLESRRRVKEQQRRVFKSEFRNTHFSYILGADGVEQFVSTLELHSDEAIESDPLPPGQVWGVSLGTGETGPGLYRIEVTCGPGGGVKILNQPTPPAFRESVRVGEQNLYTRSKELVGDRNPREEEFSIQMRPMDADKTGAGLGVPVIVRLVRRPSWTQHARRHYRRRRAQPRRINRDDSERRPHRGACHRQAGSDAIDACVCTTTT